MEPLEEFLPIHQERIRLWRERWFKKISKKKDNMNRKSDFAFRNLIDCIEVDFFTLLMSLELTIGHVSFQMLK